MAAESPSDHPGPYRVERVDTDDGPARRLIGPGLDNAKLYAWEEVREKLTEMAHLMNFAYAQALRQIRSEVVVDPSRLQRLGPSLALPEAGETPAPQLRGDV